jgi:hypothetical protein
MMKALLFGSSKLKVFEQPIKNYRPIPVTAGKGIRRQVQSAHEVSGHHSADEAIECF